MLDLVLHNFLKNYVIDPIHSYHPSLNSCYTRTNIYIFSYLSYSEI